MFFFFFYQSLQNYISLGVTELFFRNWERKLLFPFVQNLMDPSPKPYGSKSKTLKICYPPLHHSTTGSFPHNDWITTQPLDHSHTTMIGSPHNHWKIHFLTMCPLSVWTAQQETTVVFGKFPRDQLMDPRPSHQKCAKFSA